MFFFSEKIFYKIPDFFKKFLDNDGSPLLTKNVKLNRAQFALTFLLYIKIIILSISQI